MSDKEEIYNNKLEAAKLLLRQMDKSTYEGKLYLYENKIRRKSLKDLAKAMLSLAPIINTKEGQDKRAIILRYIQPQRVDKFNEYIGYNTKMFRRYASFLTVQVRLLDCQERLHYIYTSLKKEGLCAYRLNALLKNSIPSEEAVKSITEKYILDYTIIKYNGKTNRIYLAPIPDFLKKVEKIVDIYTLHLQEAKALTTSLEEYVSNHPKASEFIPTEIQQVIDISFKDNSIRFDMDFLKGWLKDIEKVENTTLLREWEGELNKATENEAYSKLFPSLDEVEAQPSRIIALTGKNNFFEYD